MRELRFRAWHKDSYIELNDLRGNKSIYFGPYDLGIITQSIDRKEVVLEQYTGLKDNNGKEIYEGDIVRICRSYGYGFLPKGAVAVVSYDENECCYKLKKQGEFRLTSKKMVEVIGNIHENPELLEQEDGESR